MGPRAIENPTAIERFVCLVRLPYPLAALFWSVVLGSPGFYTVQYLETGTTTFSPADLPAEFLFFLVPFYLFFMVRYMRLRVVAAEAQIGARLSGGEKDYHEAFGKMTLTAPVILLTVGIGTVVLSFPAFSDFVPKVSALAAFDVTSVYLSTLGFSTYLWVFATACLGLHKLGGSSLKLGPFLEERMMGARPMGSLALSLTVAYFGGLLVVILLFSGFLASSISIQALLGTFLVLGVAMFFLPLNRIHAKMQAEKRRLQREISIRYSWLNQSPSQQTEGETLDNVRIALARLTDLQELEMLDKKIGSLPTWPFDIQVVSKFVTIVLSVTAVLLSRLITGILHI